MRTLADLIQFNIDHCPQEMRYFGQELFELAETFSGDLSDPDYLAARAERRAGRTDGLDRVLDDFDLDVLVSPAYSEGYSAAAVAGYASISVPAGVAEDGRPGSRLHVRPLPRRAEAARRSPTTSSRSSATRHPDVPRQRSRPVP